MGSIIHFSPIGTLFVGGEIEVVSLQRRQEGQMNFDEKSGRLFYTDRRTLATVVITRSRQRDRLIRHSISREGDSPRESSPRFASVHENTANKDSSYYVVIFDSLAASVRSARTAAIDIPDWAKIQP